MLDVDEDFINGMPFNEVIKLLVKEINHINEVLMIDDELRKQSPALQDAYDQYQVIKKLSKNE